jgi:hypothetical protein
VKALVGVFEIAQTRNLSRPITYYIEPLLVLIIPLGFPSFRHLNTFNESVVNMFTGRADLRRWGSAWRRKIAHVDSFVKRK